MRGKESPPKYVIVNGFVIGCFPEVNTFTNSEGKRERIKINIKEKVSEVLRTFLASIRPNGYIFTQLGGARKPIMGHLQFFEMDQARVCAVINLEQLRKTNS